jgi:hypothetical protein
MKSLRVRLPVVTGLWVRWRAARLAREAKRRRELTAAIGPLSGNWIQSHYYTSSQRRERD